MKKRILSLALTLLMLVMLVPAALAAVPTSKSVSIEVKMLFSDLKTKATFEISNMVDVYTGKDIHYNAPLIEVVAVGQSTVKYDSGFSQIDYATKKYDKLTFNEEWVKDKTKNIKAIDTVAGGEFTNNKIQNGSTITLAPGNVYMFHSMNDDFSTFSNVVIHVLTQEEWDALDPNKPEPTPEPTPVPTPAPIPNPAETATAAPTASKVFVDGKEIAFDAYTINQENYIKLRDVAYTLNGTRVQFEAGWDGASSTISFTSGKAYTPDGSEMKAKGTESKTANLNKSKILLNGQEIVLTAYTIGGNNYFRLRELAEVFNFSVAYDGTVIIDTTKEYTKP